MLTVTKQTSTEDLAAACLARADGDPSHPTAAAVDALLAQAWAWGASDVHVSPAPEVFVVRFRLDGVLTEVARLPRARLPLLVQRIKVLAGLLTYRTDCAQDGRVPADAALGRGELRVSVVPTLHGEKAVLRLMGDAAGGPRAVDALGWPDDARAALREGVAGRQGLVVFAGPAGAGKTTAIYAALRALVAEGRACASIEEPVEAALDGVDQTPVDRAAGLTFAAALRALLRHDPEVLFVGEVRDRETAAIAVEAGLTGHLVLTTVHAGSAAEAVARLLDLGVEPFALGSALRRVFAQRLVRRRCCEAGCERCRGTGFAGRLPLVEHLALAGALRAGVLAGRSAVELEAAAREAGLVTLAARGQAAVDAGLTTAAELARALGADAGRSGA